MVVVNTKTNHEMKNIQKVIFILISVSILGCNSNLDQKQKEENTEVEINKSEIKKFENIFQNLKEYLAKENGKLWDHQLYGPILLVNPDSRYIIANEPDNMNFLTKNGNLYIGILPDEMNIANTALEWNGKVWTMLMLPLPEDKNEQLNLFTHELFHRIQSQLGLANMQQMPCNHLDELDGRIYLKLEFEALKMALATNDKTLQAEHIKNALTFRLYRYQLYPEANESENSLELNEGIAEYTGTILSDRTDEDLKIHYVKAIDELYTNKTFVRSFAYRTIPVYGYFTKQTNEGWNKEISNKNNLTDYFSAQFDVSVNDNLGNIVAQIGDEYGYQNIYRIESEREIKQKELIARLETKFLKSPTLTLPVQSMDFSFSPGELIPFNDIGTVYPNVRVTDSWGILSVSEDALIGKKWDKIIVSEPIEISETILKGAGWELQLNNDWKLEKTEENYTLKKK